MHTSTARTTDPLWPAASSSAPSVVPDAAPSPLPVLRRHSPARLVPAGTAGLFRVLDRAGRIVGHVQSVASPDGTRYRAQRFSAERTRFVPLGEFWSIDDAVACLPVR